MAMASVTIRPIFSGNNTYPIIINNHYQFMKRLRTFLTLLFAVTVGLLSAQTLTVKREKDKFGYADEAGNMVIKAQYKKAYPFGEDGRAKVQKGDKWGYIDKTGKPVIRIEYDEIGEFKDNKALVKKNKKYGYLNYDGTFYIKPDYNFIGTPNDKGWIWVGKGKTLKEAQLGLYHNDVLVIKPMLCYLGFYCKTDTADYTLGNAVSLTSGIPDNYEIKQNLSKLTTSDEPYIWTSLGGKTAIYDLDGKLILKPQSGAVGMPKDGYAMIRTYNSKKKTYTYNYVTVDGKTKKLFKKPFVQKIDEENIYESCHPFNGGIALCGTENKAYLVNTKGDVLTPVYNYMAPVVGYGFISKADNLYGLVSPKGDVIMAPTYSNILLPFENTSIMPARNSAGQFGFINFKGEEVVPFHFEDAKAFFDGKGYVKENGKYGVIDVNGKYLVANRWNDITPAIVSGCDYIWVNDGGKWQCLQISTDKLCFDEKFDEVAPFDKKNRALYKSGDLFGAVSANGATVLPLRFTSVSLASDALDTIDKENKEAMTDSEAYRFNIYHHPDRHKFNLNQSVSAGMWDY